MRPKDLLLTLKLSFETFGRTSISRFGLRLKPVRDLPVIATHPIFEGVSGLSVDVETTGRAYVNKRFLANLPSAIRVVVTEVASMAFPGPLQPSNLLGEQPWVPDNQPE